MAMQATRALEVTDLNSGTFAAERPHDALDDAHRLACEIERLLAPLSDEAMVREPYGRKIARAITRSLIDQLADLSRDTRRTKLG
jgi:hypothetical protein